MLQRGWRTLAGLVVLFQMSGLAYAQGEPDRVVEQYVAALAQGRFAEARTRTLESANVDGSVFGSWLFGARGAGLPADTADLFLSQKFVQAFRYTITGTMPVGENQVYVTAIRSSPDLAHLYEWAVLPNQGAAPYDIVTAIDTYLTTVNFPMEESRLRFTLVREVDIWLISAVTDARFARLQKVPGSRTARPPRWPGRRDGGAAGGRRAGTAAPGTQRHHNFDGHRAAFVRRPIRRHLAGLQRYLSRPRPGRRRRRSAGSRKAAVLATPGAAPEAQETGGPGGRGGDGKVPAEHPRGDQPLHGR